MTSKKELKEAYKQMKTPMGVFQIRNIVTNKVLVDHSTDMASKWNRHKTELNFGNHRNKSLQNDWNEYGSDQFVFEVLSELKPQDDEPMDYQKELKVLQEMVEEEIENGNFYS